VDIFLRLSECTRLNAPNGILIGSAVLEGFKIVTDRPTDRQTDRQTTLYAPSVTVGRIHIVA